MIELQWPWMLLLLPLPLLVWWRSRPAPETGGGALRVPFYARFADLRNDSGKQGSRASAIVAFKAVLWSLLVLAAARPAWIGEAQPIASHGRDLMLALDLSGSMETPDFEFQGQALERLSVVRAVAKNFVNEREGDRVGLVLFGSRAYLQAPLTLDHPTVVQMLDESEIGLAGEETAIGDAIGLAVKHLRDRPADERVLILLSDGANNAGVLEPVQAAQLAATEGIRVYTIGLGTGAQMVRTPFGTRLAQGQGQLDEATLKEVADLTGGVYFRARDTASLLQAHAQIDALEKTEGEAVTVHPTQVLFYWPLGAALIGTAGLLAFMGLRESKTLLERNHPKERTETTNESEPWRSTA
ncbi:MAG: VWA domain-containing protein [Myxococcota bacterium]|nr:VWA domain-containing protein [Myxococcota bacterium]